MTYQISAIQTSPPKSSDTEYRYLSPFTRQTLPDAADLANFQPRVEQQGQIGTCLSNALTSGGELLTKRGGRDLEFSRLFINFNTLVAENRLGEQGVYTRDILDSARKQGICLEATHPYIEDRQFTKPSEPAYVEALNWKLDRYEWIAGMSFSGQEPEEIEFNIMSANAEGCPVLIATPVGQMIYTLAGPWETQYYPRVGTPGNAQIGLHGMLMEGYKRQIRRGKLLNSWSKEWGDNGILGLGYEHFTYAYFEAVALRGFAGFGVTEAQGIKLENLSRFRLDCRIVPFGREVGTMANIWIGAVIQDVLYLKQGGTWSPVAGGYQHDATIKLAESNYVSIVLNTDLTPFAGARVYVAYGQDVTCFNDPAHLKELCVIPQF